ncbi:MAG: MFS transporter [Pseudomonadota bacterium]
MPILTLTQTWIFCAGILAAAHLGKLPALMPEIRPELGIGLVLGALIISIMEIGGALFGAVSATFAQKLSQGGILKVSILALGLGSLGEASATGSFALLSWRLLEAAGYLGVIVTAPVLMARAARPGEAPRSLAIWSTFVAIGIALGSIVSGLVAEHHGWRVALGFWALFSFAFLALGLLVRLPTGETARTGFRWPSRLELTAAAGFGCFASFQVGLFALTPEYLISMRGFDVQGAAGLVGLGAGITALGALAPLLMRRAFTHRRSVNAFLWVSLVVPGLLGFVVFLQVPVWLVATAFLLLNAVSGIFAALAFARIPLMSLDGDVTGATGALAQFGAAGSLLGPPAFGLAVSLGGWLAAAAFGLVVSVLALILTLLANRRLYRMGFS